MIDSETLCLRFPGMISMRTLLSLLYAAAHKTWHRTLNGPVFDGAFDHLMMFFGFRRALYLPPVALVLTACFDKVDLTDCDTGLVWDPVDGWCKYEDGTGSQACKDHPDCDGDGDGYTETDGDCDDENAQIFPDRAEVCDGEDNDCDGDVDEEVKDTFYADVDGDGFGDPDQPQEACEATEEYVANDMDCDDDDPLTYPTADEYCDGIDNDCDDFVDEEPVDGQEWYPDADVDGFGDETATPVIDCDQPEGYVSNDNDCNDADDTINPYATEVCDGGNVDEDCNGLADDDDDYVDEDSLNDWFADADGDTFGDPDDSTTACDQPTGYVGNHSDCDDSDTGVNPYASEVCDGLGVDENCDGITDEERTWYADTDSDGYGDASVTEDDCATPTGYVADNTDCDDTEATTNPGATEYCDLADNDCDGSIDESDAADAVEWWADTDSDGYGDVSSSTYSCSEPSGFVDNDDDCDDSDADISPDATEECDSADLDEDCNGYADDADSGVDTSTQTTWYADSDADGYGDLSSTMGACDEPSGYVADNSDCDDGDSGVNPGATEVCDSADVDEDCDGDVDDADSDVDTSTHSTFYADDDLDGYGDASSSTTACDEPSGYVTDDTDCDDTNGDINPAATEVCDEDDVDEDCDGSADDSDSSTDASSMTDWYPDSDSDGFGDNSASATSQCEQPSGYVADNSDCDDADDTTGSGDWYPDQDEDDYGDDSASITSTCTDPSDVNGCTDGDTSTLCYVAAENSDCDDTNAAVNPDGIEAFYDLATDTATNNCADTFDNDCNGDTDSSDDACYDLDGDGLEDGLQLAFAYDIDGDGSDEGLYFTQAFADAGSAWSESDCITSHSYPWTSITVADANADVTDGVTWGGYTYEAEVCLLPHIGGYVTQRAFSGIGSDGSTAVDATDPSDWIDIGVQTYCANADAGGNSDYCGYNSTYGVYFLESTATYSGSSWLVTP